MIVNKCSEILLAKSKKLYGNYRDNCTVVQRMLEKYKKLYPNISDYSIMHFIDIAEFCDMIMDKQKLKNLAHLCGRQQFWELYLRHSG